MTILTGTANIKRVSSGCCASRVPEIAKPIS
jgi:hypothetical protein